MAKNPENIPLPKRILSAMLNFGVANVMTKLIGFFLIPLYTQYLTPKDYGIVELCASLAAFTIVFMRLGVPGSVTRFYFDHKDNPKELNDYVTTIHKLLLVASLVIGAIIATICYFFSEDLLAGVLFIPFIGLVLITAAFSANNDLQKRLIQSKEESAYMAKLNIATATINIALALLFVIVLELGALGLILAQSITALIFFLQSQYYLRKYLKGTFRPAMLKSSVKYGLGLLPHHLFAVFAPLLSKGILNYKESLAALGIFSLAIRFMQPLDILYDLFNKSFTPIYFSLRNNNEEGKVKDVYRLVWYIAVAIFSGVVLVIPSMIPLITPERFHQSSSLIPILALGFLGQILYMFFVQERFYDKKTKFVSIVTGIGLVVNLLVTILTVSEYGVYSIAFAYMSGFVSWAIAGYILSDKYFLNFIDIKTIIYGLLIAALIFITAVYTPHQDYLVRFVALAGVMAIIAVTNFKRLKKITVLLKR